MGCSKIKKLKLMASVRSQYPRYKLGKKKEDCIGHIVSQ